MTFIQSEFQPRFTGGHWQTLYAWAKARSFPRLPAPVARYFDVAADARVLAHCHWHDRPQEHPTLVLLHGLEGSSPAHYMRGMADKAWAARLERRAPQPAQLRRHRAAVARPLSLGADARSALRDARADRARRPPRASPLPATRSAATWR